MRDLEILVRPSVDRLHRVRRGPALEVRFWRRLLATVVGLGILAGSGALLRAGIVIADRCSGDPVYARVAR